MSFVQIHLSRIQKPTRHFTDGFVEDSGHRLKTHTVIPTQFIASWSEAWQQEGKIPYGQVIGSVNKYMFYHEYFSIMEIHSTTDQLLGYYVDITTPVRKENGEYYLDDLILDFWVLPDQTYQVLDEEEWQAAVQAGWIAGDIQRTAWQTFRRLKGEIKSGRFPKAYIAA